MSMTLTRKAPGSEGKFELCPAGNHLAVLYGVVELGTQDHPWAMEQDKRWYPEVRLIWELTDEAMADGRPFSVSESYRVSLHEKSNLFKAIKGVLGREIGVDEEFNLKSLVGTPCNVTVVHNPERNPKPGQQAKVYANVGSVTVLSKRDAANPPEQINDDLFYEMVRDPSGVLIPPGPDVPEWLRKKIMAAAEFAGFQAGPNLPPVPTSAVAAQQEGEGIPF